ncbi:M20 family metallopeptidase [Anaeroselena agilis]|uniref:M20 family metallopeptidase n=1 Tax=Anaeroselena agilis TaxID=3063788 RepID=A0ABU3P0L2_9FIRM|nr:M20 family metallopeptidase [Selenomonadales bacterium 4137-cl]
MKDKAFRFVEENRQAMIELWRELVSMESGSADKAGVDAVALRLKQFLDSAGGTTKLIEMETAGNMLVGEIGAGRAKPGILFVGHMDTVFPAGTIAKRPFTIKDGTAYGPGVLDMKGGIVAFLYAIMALKAAGYDARPLKVVLAGDEEVGHAHSDAAGHIMHEARGCVAAFNCETGFVDDGIVLGRKGTAEFTLEVKGVAVHAGNEPQNGRSAILEIAHKVIEIQKMTDYDRGITFNVGVIQGGTVKNAVPDYAKILVDIRYQDPGQLGKIKAMVDKVAAKTHIDGTSTTYSFSDGIAPMQTTPASKALFEIVRQAYEENGFGRPYEHFVGGGSDSAFTVLAGVPTVCAMGVKGGRNHSAQEYAVVETLFERAKLLVDCVLRLD